MKKKSFIQPIKTDYHISTFLSYETEYRCTNCIKIYYKMQDIKYGVYFIQHI